MNTKFATAFLFSMFVTVSASAAATFNVGDRMFSAAFRTFEIPKAGNQSRRLGAGTIIEVKKDGSALFLPDRRPQESVTDDEVQLTRQETAALRKRVSCPALMSTQVYSNQKATVEYRNMLTTAVLGEGRVIETFGNCERGVAIFQRLDLTNHSSIKTPVAIAGLLPEVSCQFLDEKVLAPKLGIGIAKRAWGDCTRGIVIFESMKREAASVPVLTQSLRFQKQAANENNHDMLTSGTVTVPKVIR